MNALIAINLIGNILTTHEEGQKETLSLGRRGREHLSEGQTLGEILTQSKL